MASADILNLLERRINKLENIAEEVENLGIKLLQNAPIEPYLEHNGVESYHWGLLKGELSELQREAFRKYQQFYTSAFQLVQEYLPEKEPEFVDHYRVGQMYGNRGVAAYLQLETYISSRKRDRDEIVAYFVKEFEIQRSILQSIPGVFEMKEFTLRKILSSDLSLREIEQADILFEHDFKRAAGAIAGVALELHLRTLCDLQGIEYNPKATLNTYISELYKAQIIEITEKNALETLASIRNKCAHPEEVSEKSIRFLLDEVRKRV